MKTLWKIAGMVVVGATAFGICKYIAKRREAKNVQDIARIEIEKAEQSKPGTLKRKYIVYQAWRPVTGVTFEGRQETIKKLQAEGIVAVELKPAVVKDYPNAVAVYANGQHIGYLPDKPRRNKLSTAAVLRPVVEKSAAIVKAIKVVTGSKGLYGVRILIQAKFPNKSL